MFYTVRPFRHLPYRRAQRGQTLIAAIAVIFVLMFIGGVFVAQVAQNLIAAGRSRVSQDADALARAGITYCDTQLTYSIDGADWRPAPTAPITSPTDPAGLTDPDYFWLSKGFARIPSAGGRFLVRISYDPQASDPRSQLLKIEAVGRPGELSNGLDPTVFVQEGPAPRQRRELIAYKQIGLTDYLRFITNQNRRESENVLGVPAIGQSVAMVLGDPTIAQTLTSGQPGVNNNEILIGAPIRCNGSLRFAGDVMLYMNPRRLFEGVQVSGKVLLGPTRDVNGINGLDDQDLQVFINQTIAAPSFDVGNAVRSSDDPDRTTNGGLVRDRSNQPDQLGYTNNIPRLEGPVINTYTEGGNGPLRYRSLTRFSGEWKIVDNTRFNTGENGWGRGVYINNPRDLQAETTRAGVNGSYSLRADWMNPNAQFAQSYWQGPSYRPPGVDISMRGDRIVLTRNDDRVFTKPDGTPITLQGGKVVEIPLADDERASYTFPDGSVFALPILSHDGDDTTNVDRPFNDKNSYGVNLVIYAEGNVRVHGVYGTVTDPNDNTKPHLSRVHLTIVTGGTAYIDGNIVKGDGYLDGTKVQHLERASTCAILAKDYITVNTTMFMSPENQTNAFSRLTPDLDSFGAEVGLSRPTFDMSSSFGVNPLAYTYNVGNAPSSPLMLLLRHSALNPGPAYINLFINPALIAGGADPRYLFNLNGPNINGQQVPPPETYIVGSKYLPPPNQFIPVTDENAITPNFEGRAFPLTGPVGTFTAITSPGYPNLYRFATDQSAAVQANSLGINLSGASDYLLGGAMVTPLDIRIEALLYAQEHSFFVIPGYPFNPDAKDSRAAFLSNGLRSSYSKSINALGNSLDTAADKLAKDIFPFYGEPVDVRITIFGSVTENYTASQGDQAAWMGRWGYIPTEFGSSGLSIPDAHIRVHDVDGALPAVQKVSFGYVPGEDTSKDFRTQQEVNARITRGLRFIYDPALAMPYLHPTDVNLDGDGKTDTRAKRAIRLLITPNATDPANPFRQVLPPMPRLPVCPGLLYYGDSDHLIGS